MSSIAQRTSGGQRWLDARTWKRLGGRVEQALRRARAAGRPMLVSISAPLDGDHDPSAIALRSRRPGEPWFCLEQPDRDRAALAGLGCLHELRSGGEDRFSTVAARWRELAAAALCDDLSGPSGSGLVALGGFAFAPAGGASPRWSGFDPASLIVPELSLARRGGVTWITANAEVAPDDTGADVLGRVSARLSELRSESLALLDPAPVGAYEVVSPLAPAHYEEAVARAVARIAAGELEKVVLAREVEVHAPLRYDPAGVIGLLRAEFGSSFVYAIGRGEATFIGATPELLIRREGQRASTVALAGSARRSADPSVDDHLGEGLLRSDKEREENAIVARRIARALRPHSVWVTTAPEPVLVRVANIQHLAMPIRAQLAEPLGVVELAGVLHPTPAVGAEPAQALALIPALEGFDRGWYAGPVGWTDAAGDGEFCVALRCALLRDRSACCFAGCGIVRESDPAAELAETEVKLQVMLPVLTG
jgi:menaquinone-specific isochorismate synthase